MYIGEKVSMDSFARHNLFCHVFQSFDDMRSLVALPVLHLDKGKRQFDRRWGYEALDCILENTLHHFNMGRLFHRVCLDKLIFCFSGTFLKKKNECKGGNFFFASYFFLNQIKFDKIMGTSL